MRNILWLACVLSISALLYSEMTVIRPYPTLEEIDGSPSNRYPLIKVPNGSLQDNTTFWTLLISSVTPTTLPSNSTSYIQNRSTLQSGSTFFVSSGTVDGISFFGSTVVGDTGRFRIVQTSTVTGSSPLVLDSVLKIIFNDGTVQVSSPIASVNAGDNLGSHIATKTLDMGNFRITNSPNLDNLDTSTATLGLTASNTNYLTVLASTQTKLGGLNLSGVITASSGTFTTTVSAVGLSVSTIQINSVTYFWPTSDGANGQVPKTNGSGVITWSNDNTGGGGGSADNLGSHVATKTLDMNSFIITNIASGTAFGTFTSSSGFVGVGSSLTILNADNLGLGMVPNVRIDPSSVTKLGSSIDLSSEVSGILSDGSLSANVTLLDNQQTFTGSKIFNANIQLGNGQITSSAGVSGITISTTVFFGTGATISTYTRTSGNLDLAGTIANDDIQNSSITKQGNAFNSANQLLQLDGNSFVPNARIDPSSITKLGASIDLGSEVSGTLSDSNLSGNVSLLGPSIDSSEIANGTIVDEDLSDGAAFSIGSMTAYGTFTSSTGFVGIGSTLTALNASNISLGTLSDSRLSVNVSLLGSSIESGEIANNTITGDDISQGAVVIVSSVNAAVITSSNPYRGSGVYLSNTIGLDDNGTVRGFARAIKVTGAGNGGVTVSGDTATITLLDTTGSGGGGDNLGSHIATQTINVNSFGIVGSTSVKINSMDVFVSSFSRSSLEGYVMMIATMSVPASGTITITTTTLDVDDLYFPTCTEFNNLQKLQAQVVIDAVTIPDSFRLWNGNAGNASDCICHIPVKPR